MNKLVSTLIVTGVAAFAFNAQAASHAGGAPMAKASGTAAKASAPMAKASTAMKKDEAKK